MGASMGGNEAARYQQLAQECRARVEDTRNSVDAEAWLKLAAEWLVLARQDRDGASDRAAIDARRR